jgi:hypothetical protein
MDNYKIVYYKNKILTLGIIHAESQLPTNWFDTHGFFSYSLLNMWSLLCCFGIE